MLQPHIIMILADDQRWDVVNDLYMPRTMQRIRDQGVSFTNAFATSPQCGPARGALFTGDLASRHGALNNTNAATISQAWGANTLAGRLQAAGYYTALVGKYLNDYHQLCPPNRTTAWIPPGWNSWCAFRDNNDTYVDYALVTGATTIEENIQDYSTDLLALRAKTVIDHRPWNKPLFLLLAPAAPHSGVDMQPSRYLDAMGTETPWRPPSFNEADMSDKASLMRALPLFADGSMMDTQRRMMLEATLALDDLVEVVWRCLAHLGDNVVFLYTADQGNFYGEHRLMLKGRPYDEAHRAPLLIRYPAKLTPRVEQGLVTHQDITQTLLAWAGAAPLGQDGHSIATALSNATALCRTTVPLEGYMPNWQYTGTRTLTEKHITWHTGETEHYNLVLDPFELNSIP